MASRAGVLCVLIPLLAGSLLASTGHAAPSTCPEAVADLAERYGIVPSTPAGMGERDPEISAGDLQRSGGVIAPPSTGETPVIEPEATPSMPTAPPMTGSGSSVPGGGMTGQDQTAVAHQAESLLGSALAAAEQGDEAQCAARLEEARAVLGSPMPGTVTPRQ
ncbi:hypothetical protein [Indioceanicola profundi]|uniref:hypothetical protein n=1 Tax=Indioceanicola profundi TaxID=2220096 RepID=UPI000E6ADC9E|nr:hypothetical protein [Indioceanicola profundi]